MHDKLLKRKKKSISHVSLLHITACFFLILDENYLFHDMYQAVPSFKKKRKKIVGKHDELFFTMKFPALFKSNAFFIIILFFSHVHFQSVLLSTFDFIFLKIFLQMKLFFLLCSLINPVSFIILIFSSL